MAEPNVPTTYEIALSANNIASGISPAISSPLNSNTTQLASGVAAKKTVSATGNTANTVLIADPTLSITLNETGWYNFDAYLAVCAANATNVIAGTAANGFGGFQFDIGSNTAILSNYSAQVSGYGNAALVLTAALSSPGNLHFTNTNVGIALTTTSWYSIEGTFQVTTPGTLGIRWASSVSSTNSVAVLAGSWIQATKIG